MKIILNSDVLFDKNLVTTHLSRTLEALLEGCAQRGHAVVLPLTAKREFDRNQSEVLPKTASELRDAYALLQRLGINFDKVEPDTVIRPPDPVQLFRTYKVKVILEKPTIDDFQEAHRRACLHELPHPPKGKSDEMRDLLIWVMALRTASHEGGALLLSRDEVHTHIRGDSEANRARLVRVKTAEEALEYLDVVTPSGRLIEQLLAPAWANLRQTALALSDHPSIVGVKNARFVQGVKGPASAACELKTRASDGETIHAFVEIRTAEGIVTSVEFDNITHGGKQIAGPIQVQPNVGFAVEPDDYSQRLEALKSILKGEP